MAPRCGRLFVGMIGISGINIVRMQSQHRVRLDANGMRRDNFPAVPIISQP